MLPGLPPPSFPPVTLLPASRWTAASVIVPQHHHNDHDNITDRSVEGNILCIDQTHYFWLQRIVRTTANGKIRAGFCLKSPSTTTSSNSSGAATWEVEVVHRPSNNNNNDSSSNENQSIEAQVQMVAIRIEDATNFMDSPELAALSYVATALHPDDDNDNDDTHIQNAMLLAADESNVYIVTPYDIATSMSLRDYCLAQPQAVVSEFQTREFTKQIFKVRGGGERNHNDSGNFWYMCVAHFFYLFFCSSPSRALQRYKT